MSISRRVYRRHSVHLRVWLEFGSDWVAGETVDASRSGVFVRIERLVKVGEQVRLRAELLDGRMLELRGVVRRVAEAGGAGAGPGLAIELVGNHPAVRAQWEAFVLGVGGESRRALAHHTGIHIGERSDSLAKDVIRAQVQAAKRRVGAGGAAQPGGRPAGRRLGARQLTIVPRSEEELAGIGDCARMGTRLYLATPEVCETGERVIVIVLHTNLMIVPYVILLERNIDTIGAGSVEGHGAFVYHRLPWLQLHRLGDDVLACDTDPDSHLFMPRARQRHL